MQELDIAANIQDDIRQYILSVADNKTRQNDIKEFLETLKPELQKRVNLYIFFVAINKNDLINDMFKIDGVLDFLEGYNYKKREF